jgi:RNA polymerase sigma factor (sigma-70 family)
LAAAPSIGRAAAVEAPPRAPEVELTQALYERYSHQLYGYCFAKLGSREEAEDAVQTTFLNAFRALERGVVPQAESAWLFKIAENVCLSRHRSSFRRRRVESPSDLAVLQDVVPAREHGGDELVGLERVLEQMPQGQRRAILLREWQGLSYREIADELQLTQAAVETLIFRARRSLAQGLESLDDRERKPHRRRVRRGAHAGGLIAALKTFLGTAAGMKAAATVVAVGSATVIAATPPSLRQVLTGRVQRVAQHAPAVKYHHPAAVAAVAVAAASAGSAGAGPVTPAATRAASPTHPFAPALLVSHRSAAPVRPAAPVEGAATAAAPMPVPVPAPSAAAPVAVVPAAPAPVEVAPVPQSPPVQAPASPPAVEPRDGAPAAPVAATQQQLVSAPAKEKGHDNGQQGQAAPGGLPSGHDGTGENGYGGQKTDVRAIAIVSAPAGTTSPSAPTSPVAPPSAPAATTTSGAAPAPAAAPAAPADRGHRGDGHGGGNGGGGGGDGNAHGNGNGGGDGNRQASSSGSGGNRQAGSSGSGNGNGNGSDNQH